jgi:hypothetical protein
VVAGLLVALTLPGLVLLLVALAVVERVAARGGRRGPVSRRARPRLSAGAFGAFAAAMSPGPSVQQAQQRVEQMIGDRETSRQPRTSRWPCP